MPIDLLFIIVFAAGFRHGYVNGIISTAFNIIAYVFGIILAFKVTPATTNIMERLFHSQNPSMFLLAFIANVAIIMLVLRQTAKAIEGILRALYLGIFNRILGGVVMASIYTLVYSILLWFSVRVNFVNDATLAESRTYPILKNLPGQSKAVGMRFQPFAREMWDTSLGWMDRLKTYGDQKTESMPSKIYSIPDDGRPIETDPQERTQQVPGRQAPVNDNGGIEE